MCQGVEKWWSKSPTVGGGSGGWAWMCAGQAAALTMGMTMGKRGCGARHRVGCARRARVRFGQRALVGSGHVEQGARSVGGGREVEGGGGVWRWRGIKKRHVHQLLSRRKRARAGVTRKRPHGGARKGRPGRLY